MQMPLLTELKRWFCAQSINISLLRSYFQTGSDGRLAIKSQSPILNFNLSLLIPPSPRWRSAQVSRHSGE